WNKPCANSSSPFASAHQNESGTNIMDNKTIFVFMDRGTMPTALVGKLFVDSGKGKESYSFEYDESWLSDPERFAIDPELPLFRGR
ncbi:MAG: hypothetical protein J6N99_07615, partial [Schwartzia sp.]|nr:hypothetical protein [Schwartzia sp. (in: firmicutes)]